MSDRKTGLAEREARGQKEKEDWQKEKREWHKEKEDWQKEKEDWQKEKRDWQKEKREWQKEKRDWQKEKRDWQKEKQDWQKEKRVRQKEKHAWKRQTGQSEHLNRQMQSQSTVAAIQCGCVTNQSQQPQKQAYYAPNATCLHVDHSIKDNVFGEIFTETSCPSHAGTFG